MDIVVTVIVLLAVIAMGAFLIHRLNAQHGDRTAAFHYGRGGMVAPDRDTTDRDTTDRDTTDRDTTDRDTTEGRTPRRTEAPRPRPDPNDTP
jgi:hypothetical protein